MPDPNEMVVVQLKQDRMYRPDPAERAVVTVKKGEATVPRWVAQEWGLLPVAATDPTAPVTAAEMKELLPEAEPVEAPIQEAEPAEAPPVKPAKITKAKAT